jgi:hypothetical protein
MSEHEKGESSKRLPHDVIIIDDESNTREVEDVWVPDSLPRCIYGKGCYR